MMTIPNYGAHYEVGNGAGMGNEDGNFNFTNNMTLKMRRYKTSGGGFRSDQNTLLKQSTNSSFIKKHLWRRYSQ